MARKLAAPLSSADLEQFLAEEADFSFEMSVLSALRAFGIAAEHAAVYTDPITNRIRAYDIRGRWSDDHRHARLAVECKNLRSSAPLLIHATPRTDSEAYHTVVTRFRLGGYLFQSAHRRLDVYGPREPVGRQTDQPMKESGGTFKSSDGAAYDKWLQAVNGCSDLLNEIAKEGLSSPEAHVLVPILVVPSDTLWQIDYDAKGEVVVPVRTVTRATIILRHTWSVQTATGVLDYDISHLEVITLAGLPQRLKNLLSGGGLLAGAEDLLKQVAR